MKEVPGYSTRSRLEIFRRPSDVKQRLFLVHAEPAAVYHADLGVAEEGQLPLEFDGGPDVIGIQESNESATCREDPDVLRAGLTGIGLSHVSDPSVREKGADAFIRIVG